MLIDVASPIAGASRLVGTVVASGEQRACWDSDRPLLEQLIELLGVAWQETGRKAAESGYPYVHTELPGAIEGSADGCGDVGQSTELLMVLRTPALRRHHAESDGGVTADEEILDRPLSIKGSVHKFDVGDVVVDVLWRGDEVEGQSNSERHGGLRAGHARVEAPIDLEDGLMGGGVVAVEGLQNPVEACISESLRVGPVCELDAVGLQSDGPVPERLGLSDERGQLLDQRGLASGEHHGLASALAALAESVLHVVETGYEIGLAGPTDAEGALGLTGLQQPNQELLALVGGIVGLDGVSARGLRARPVDVALPSLYVLWVGVDLVKLRAHDAEPTMPRSLRLCPMYRSTVSPMIVALWVHGSMADLECGSFFPFDEDQESCAEEELDLFGLIEFCPQRLGEACSPRGVLFSVVSEFQEIAHEVRGSGWSARVVSIFDDATVPGAYQRHPVEYRRSVRGTFSRNGVEQVIVGWITESLYSDFVQV